VKKELLESCRPYELHVLTLGHFLPDILIESFSLLQLTSDRDSVSEAVGVELLLSLEDLNLVGEIKE